MTYGDKTNQIRATLTERGAPMSRAQLRDATGMSAKVVTQVIRKLRATGNLRIAVWVRPEFGRPHALFELGTEPDAPERMDKKTRKQINRDYERRRHAMPQHAPAAGADLAAAWR